MSYARRSMFEVWEIFSADLHPILWSKERFCRPLKNYSFQSKLPCVGWKSANFYKVFCYKKYLQDQCKHTCSSTKISMDHQPYTMLCMNRVLCGRAPGCRAGSSPARAARRPTRCRRSWCPGSELQSRWLSPDTEIDQAGWPGVNVMITTSAVFACCEKPTSAS
jgi:hypothetical protein